MIEVEVKLPLHSRSDMHKRLEACGFVPGDLVRESDIYFTSSFHDFIALDEALRIRTCENMTRREETSFLTFKGRKIDTVSMTRQELETGVEDGDTVRDILTALGFQPLFPVIKLRQYYHRDNMCACLDQVRDLGSFMELEIQVPDEEDRAGALARIEEVLARLGSGLHETTRRSYLSMLMKLKD